MDKNMKAKIEGYIAKGQNEDAVYDSLKAEGFSAFAIGFHLDQYVNENGEINPVQIDESKALESFGSFTIGKGEEAPKKEVIKVAAKSEEVVLFKSNPDPLRGSKGVKRKLYHFDDVPHIAHRGGYRAVKYLEFNQCWTWAKGSYYGGY